MKFYNREKEISRLHEIRQASRNNTQLTVVTGRRRIGKTQLMLKATESEAILEEKRKNPMSDTSTLETEIDLLVYKLYGLTYDEVLTIDPKTPITKQKYIEE